MDDDDHIYDYTRRLLLDIMAVLFVNGIRKVPVGAAMRLMGVHNDNAVDHDHEWIEIEENFGETLQKLNIVERFSLQNIPKGTTIH